MDAKIPSANSSIISVLNNDRGQKVYLIGTAHISEQSCFDVEQLILSVKPKGVFLELCDQRKEILEKNDNTSKTPVSLADVYKDFRNNPDANSFSLIYAYMLKSVAEEIGVEPGSEFRIAYQSAQKIEAFTILGDRSVSITVNRLWNGFSFFQKCNLAFKLVREGLSSVKKDRDIKEVINEMRISQDTITEAIKELGEDFPWFVECLIRERDQFMVLELKQVLSELPEGDIVAVVGAGHVEGMTEEWHLKRSAEESEEIHFNIQTCPANTPGFSVEMLR